MDVQQNNTRGRVFSILNDNDCPSFVIRSKQASQSSSSPPARRPSVSAFTTRTQRPAFLRHSEYTRNSSISSAGSPPLLRYDSTSSKSSASSMDSTPSPSTPAYSLNDAAHLPYDGLRTDLGTPYLASPSSVTPFLEHQLMIGPTATQQLPTFEPKTMVLPPSSALAYPSVSMTQAQEQQLATPALSNHASMSSTSSAQSKPSPNSTGNNSGNNANMPNGVKKSKYPCPYASSHNCVATFTTSGHAARHGKKHTGEKGVHCPICNKAFTRKDNMKQHERTHKNAGSKISDDNRSKAALTKDAQKMKSHKKSDSEASIAHARRSSVIQSPMSEAPSLVHNTIDTPVNIPEAAFYQDPSPPLLLAPSDTIISDALASNSMYPPLGDEAMLTSIPVAKLDGMHPMPPTLVRGFSDLDTLAQAAESFDPYYQGQF